MTKLTVNAYTFGVAMSDEAKLADTIVLNLGVHLEKATQMAELAKSALHHALQFRETYEQRVGGPVSAKRTATVQKAGNLKANYYAPTAAFAFYGRQAMQCVADLVVVMPDLVKGGDIYNSTDESYGRKSNAVLCSRLILEVPLELHRLAALFQQDHKDVGHMYMAIGNCEISSLHSNMWDEKYQHRFDDSLKIPYVAGYSEKETVVALDASLVNLEIAMARGQRVLKEFSDAKARFFSNVWDSPETWVPHSEAKVAEYRELQVDYGLVRWTIDNVQKEVFHAAFAVEQAIKAVSAQRSYTPVLDANCISAKCKVVAALQLRLSMNKASNSAVRLSDLDEKTSARQDLARTALEDAFSAIPAKHRYVPVDQLLENPTRK